MNLQTIPRSDKTVKRCFVPKLDALLFADYPNIELKLLAWYLESINFPSMADVFRAGGDLHKVTASGLMGVPQDALTDDQRQVGKRLNFSIVYGGGMPTIMQQLGIEAPDALALLTNFHKTWPGIGWATKRKPAAEGTLINFILTRCAKRGDKLFDPAVSRGYITTLYGRHLHPKAEHAALNNLCQGCAADLMKWAMVEVDRELKAAGARSHIVNMVHDELILDVAADELPWVAANLPAWMTDPRIESVVPIMPECEVSFTTWADKEPYAA